MRLALLSDLHANRQALDACLSHVRSQGADRFAFLGNLVGFGADPVWVLDQVMVMQAQGGLGAAGPPRCDGRYAAHGRCVPGCQHWRLDADKADEMAGVLAPHVLVGHEHPRPCTTKALVVA